MTMKTETLKGDQTVQIDDLASTIQTLGDEIVAAKTQIADMQMNLQRASEARLKENTDFQKTVADQKATQEILAKALDKLATFYDKEGFVQTHQGKWVPKAHPAPVPHKVTQPGFLEQSPAAVHNMEKKASSKQNENEETNPYLKMFSFAQTSERRQPEGIGAPVAQAEYKPNQGATGVMQMIEKLIYEAKDMEAKAVKGEADAQAQYEVLVADTNASVKELYKEIAAKTEMKTAAGKEKTAAEDDLNDAVDELERLSKYTADIHLECDYVMKNFEIRQKARQEEIQALQQAKQILNG